MSYARKMRRTAWRKSEEWAPITIDSRFGRLATYNRHDRRERAAFLRTFN